MNIPKVIARLVLAWAALLASQFAVGMILPVNSPTIPNVIAWLMLSDAIIVLPVGIAALRSDWRDWRLFRALFLVTAGITTVNMIEGVFFLPNVGIDWRRTIVNVVFAFAVAALLWLLILRKAPVLEPETGSPIPHRSFAQVAWRFVLCSACYVFLYFLAGMIIFPYVKEFYATQHIPSPGQIVSLQFFLRGPVFILACLALLRMFRLSHFSGALAVGLAFTLLSGVAALIMPNPYFPDNVRWVHFCEVSSSNLVFGFVVGWVWGQAHRAAHLRQVTV